MSVNLVCVFQYQIIISPQSNRTFLFNFRPKNWQEICVDLKFNFLLDFSSFLFFKNFSRAFDVAQGLARGLWGLANLGNTPFSSFHRQSRLKTNASPIIVLLCWPYIYPAEILASSQRNYSNLALSASTINYYVTFVMNVLTIIN